MKKNTLNILPFAILLALANNVNASDNNERNIFKFIGLDSVATEYKEKDEIIHPQWQLKEEEKQAILDASKYWSSIFEKDYKYEQPILVKICLASNPYYDNNAFFF